MKKVLSLLMVLALVLGISSAYAATLDMSYVEKHSDIFYVYIPEDEPTKAFIDTTAGFTVGDLSFVHKYDHPALYSYIATDILAFGYGTDEGEPYLRTWIYYEGTEPIYATSATFVVDGVKYTFSNISDPDDMGENDEEYGGVYQDMCILYDTKNLAFVNALYSYVQAKIKAEDYDISIPVILHGTEDLEITMDSGSVLDWCYIVDAYTFMGGMDLMTSLSNAATLTIE